MKSIIKILVVLVFYTTNTFTQNISPGDIIKLTSLVKVDSTPIALFSSEKIDLDKNAEYLEEYKYKVIEISEDKVKLMALDFVEPKGTNSSKEDHPSEIYNNKIYTISRHDFHAFAVKSEPKERFSIGLITLPFKARPQNDFSFDTEFNLSSTLNIRCFDVAGSSFNYQIGAGIGSVGLNTINAPGLGEDEAQDVTTLTLLNGIMLQYKRVQVGLYGGVDFINNQKYHQWESNGNLWLGFGIGYSIFSITISDDVNRQN